VDAAEFERLVNLDGVFAVLSDALDREGAAPGG
jgi:hypothetical protein